MLCVCCVVCGGGWDSTERNINDVQVCEYSSTRVSIINPLASFRQWCYRTEGVLLLGVLSSSSSNAFRWCINGMGQYSSSSGGKLGSNEKKVNRKNTIIRRILLKYSRKIYINSFWCHNPLLRHFFEFFIQLYNITRAGTAALVCAALARLKVALWR